MSLLKKSFYRAVSLAPLGLFRGISPIDVLLPYHHLVSDVPVKHIDQLYPYKNRQQFARDLDYLLSRFDPLHPDELIRVMGEGRPLPSNSFLLTFDDGLREVYDTIAPLLLQKGIPAIFFLNPGYLDNRVLFYRFKLSLVLDELQHRPPGGEVLASIRKILGLPPEGGIEGLREAILAITYLNQELAAPLGECLGLSFEGYLEQVRPFVTTEQVKEMIRQGFHFGGHSMDHPNYKLLPLADQLDQTRRSCRYVREEFGLDYTFFSFPHEDADISQAFFDILSGEAMFRDAVLFGTQNQLPEPGNRTLHRFNAERPQYGIDGLVKSVLLYSAERKWRGRQVVRRGV